MDFTKIKNQGRKWIIEYGGSDCVFYLKWESYVWKMSCNESDTCGAQIKLFVDN